MPKQRSKCDIAEWCWLSELTSAKMKTYQEEKVVGLVVGRLLAYDLIGEYDKNQGIVIVSDHTGEYVTQLNVRPLEQDQHTLVQTIRAVIFDKSKLIKEHGLIEGSSYLENIFDGPYRQVVGYFGAKKLPDNHVHIVYTFCQPDDIKYGRIIRDISLVILHQKLNSFGCVEMDDVNNPIEEFEHQNWMLANTIEGSKYIYKFSDLNYFLSQLDTFKQRCKRYFKMEK